MQTCLSILVAATIAIAATSQQSLIIPTTTDAVTDGAVNNPYPFGHDGISAGTRSLRSQYVYDNSHFAGINSPIVINRLRFRAESTFTTRSGAGGRWNNVTIRLGTAGVDYLGVSTFYALNYAGGAEPVPAYTGPVTVLPWSGNWVGNPGDWWAVVTLTNPVTFDPRFGDDFVLDIANDGAFVGTTADLFTCDEDFSDCRARRVQNTQSSLQVDGSLTTTDRGLVCELTYAPAPGLYAAFSADETEVGPGQVVSFTDRSVTSTPGGAVSWFWDFDNDGVPEAFTQNPTWSYGACGTYAVSLTVVDAAGVDVRTKLGYITVGGPRADFDVTWTGVRPVNAQFTDASGGNPTTWAWDLNGDGVTDSTAQNPAWSYLSLGSRSVTLTVTNSCGSDTITKTVDTTDSELCTTNFFNSQAGSAGHVHYFDMQVTNPAGITITELGIQSNQPGGGLIRIEVWTTPNTYVGKDTNQAQWNLRSVTNATSFGFQNQTPVDIPDVYMAPGNFGIMIAYTVGGPNFLYTLLEGSHHENQDLALDFGIMRTTKFAGDLFGGRLWAGCVRYCVGSGLGALTQAGTGCLNSTGNVATLVSQNGDLPTIGESFVFELSNAPANQSVSFIVIGVANLGGLDLGLIGMPTCRLYPDPLLSIQAPTDMAGNASASLLISDNLDTIGFPIFAQGVTADPGHNGLGAVVSDALRGTVGCRR